VLTYQGVKKGLPQVVLMGRLEGRIYRCDCGKGIDDGSRALQEVTPMRRPTGPQAICAEFMPGGANRVGLYRRL